MILLLPFGKIFEAVVKVRNHFYDRGIFKSHTIGRRTISVGNVTTGGTGKTPLVAMIASSLIERGEKVCILSRGYGRRSKGRILVADGERVLVDAETGGDEPVELARRLGSKAVIISGADRLGAAAWALERFDISTFILDDGFQHRRVYRDIDIVCVDATDTKAVLRPLPAGRLREPFSNISRADMIVITRSDPEKPRAVSIIRDSFPNIPVFTADTRVVSLVTLGDHLASLETCVETPKPMFGFCGIGNPGQFFGGLEKAGFGLAARRAFRDHHSYTVEDIAAIERAAANVNAEALVTTAKDAVKLNPEDFHLPCFVAVAETSVSDPQEFDRQIFSS